MSPQRTDRQRGEQDPRA